MKKQTANTKSDELGFLLAIPKKESKIKLENAQKIVNRIKALNKIHYKDLAHRFKLSEILVRNFITELRKAAQEGMSLEEYFAKGRPFQASHKKLA